VILLIFGLAVFLRVYRLKTNFYFDSDLADNFINVRTFIESKQIPLIGPSTSHEWLNDSPLAYWILTPIIAFFNFDPISTAYFTAFMGILLIFLSYYVVRKVFSKRMAIIASILMAVSPLWIEYSRAGKYYFLSTISFFLVFLNLVGYIREKRNKNLIWTAFWLGVCISLNYSQLVLIIPVFFTFIRFVKKVKPKQILTSLFVMVLFFVPLILYDTKNNFSMLAKFALWIPYRIAGFFHLHGQNNPTTNSLRMSTESITQMLGASFFSRPEFWIFGVLIFIASIFMLVSDYRSNKRSSAPIFFLILTSFFGIFAMYIHGSAPVNYLMSTFAAPIIIFAYVIATYIKKRSAYFAGLALLIGISWLNFSYQAKNGYYQAQPKIIKDPPFIPYSYLTDIVQTITNDANGRGFSLIRSGPFDNYSLYNAKNYIYLCWYLGNKPQVSSDLVYHIYENTPDKPDNSEDVLLGGDIFLTKYESKCNCSD